MISPASNTSRNWPLEMNLGRLCHLHSHSPQLSGLRQVEHDQNSHANPSLVPGPTLYVAFTPKTFMAAPLDDQVWGREVGNSLALSLSAFRPTLGILVALLG